VSGHVTLYLARNIAQTLPTDDMTMRLSTNQKEILVWLAEQPARPYRSVPFHDSDFYGGTRWRYAETDDPSLQASISRSLRRLETRGLIERLNYVSGPKHAGRTTHVALTELGRAIAERLTK
jgi:hypothetical protein